jgi:hypothetical protein
MIPMSLNNLSFNLYNTPYIITILFFFNFYHPAIKIESESAHSIIK